MLAMISNISEVPLPAIVPWVAVAGAASVAVVLDLRTRRVPNALTGPVLLLALLWAGARSLGALDSSRVPAATGLNDALLGALVAGLPFMVLWLVRGAGAGDAKLMMAIGAWLGVGGGTLVLLFTAVAGGVIALAWAVAQRQVLVTLFNLPGVVADTVVVLRGGCGSLGNGSSPIAAPDAATPAADAAGGRGTPVNDVDAGSTAKLKHRLPYAPAIFAGVCFAAARTLFW
jgi:prepilin peptidase CpaA